MASVFKPRRGTAAQHSSFTGVSGEVTLDTTNRRWLLHDGSTVGGLTIGGTGAEASNSYVTSTFTTNTVFQSALANTNLAISDRMQVANAQALFNTLQANLVSTTNVQTRATWSALIATNTSIRSVISGTLVSNTTFQSYVANTEPRLSNLEASVGGTAVTNTQFQSYIANTEPRIAQFNSSGKLTGALVPAANVTYDLGSPDLAFRDLYLSGSTISVGGTTISGNSSGIFISDTGSGQNVQISSTQGIVVNGVQLADETGALDPDAIGQGFNESTVYEIPTNFGASENYVGESGSSSDAFGVNIGGTIYDCNEPVGRFATSLDYGALS